VVVHICNLGYEGEGRIVAEASPRQKWKIRSENTQTKNNSKARKGWGMAEVPPKIPNPSRQVTRSPDGPSEVAGVV
jgi:hypothetical protein